MAKTAESFGVPPGLAARFAIEAPLGVGAMGEVFRARDTASGETVALKLLKEDVAVEDAEERFRREAQALERLASPHVVRLLEHGAEDGRLYLVSEYLPGGSPTPVLEEPRALEVMEEVARGLGAIHEVGLIHRDLKLANVLLAEDGRAVVVDLGLSLDLSLARLTRAGASVGTPKYSAPEVLRGETAGTAADWYSWGATLFLLLEGRPPFRWKVVLEALASHHLPEPEWARVDPEGAAAAWIRPALRADPRERPASWEALQEAAAQGAPRPRRPRQVPPSSAEVLSSSVHRNTGGWSRALLLALLLLGALALGLWLG